MTSIRSFKLQVYLTFAILYSRGSLGAIGPVADLTISNADVSPDGYTRVAATAGGAVTGELITGNKGDNFQINVVNNLQDSSILRSTTIHWHGFFQKGTNWADGPAFVNQCPIAANHSFLYDFNAADQAGTFWYHSHLSTQYCDGVRGPMVVYDPADPFLDQYDVDDETTVITLADWYHTPAKSAGFFPTADSTLINGLGRWTGATESSALSVITVEQGKRYRFRLVSISCDPNFTFQIDGHTNLTVIEVDSVNHQPLTVDSIQIFAGQRYSFILTADQDIDNYWIRANPNIGSTGFSGGINSAILRYVGAEEEEPTTTQATITNALEETSLVPLTNAAAPGTAGVGNADYSLNFVFDFNSDLEFEVNGAVYESPTTPVLLQILSGTTSVTDLMPAGSIYALPSNSVIEMSFPAGVAGGPHPFHLHGHTFSVVRSAGSSTYNYDNPVQRDVVSIGAAGDNVTIRFTTDNPGPWFLHCHIDWHLERSLAVVFAEDTQDIASANVVSSAWEDLCPIYNELTDDQL